MWLVCVVNGVKPLPNLKRAHVRWQGYGWTPCRQTHKLAGGSLNLHAAASMRRDMRLLHTKAPPSPDSGW